MSIGRAGQLKSYNDTFDQLNGEDGLGTFARTQRLCMLVGSESIRRTVSKPLRGCCRQPLWTEV
jgi:hypothetical protein